MKSRENLYEPCFMPLRWTDHFWIVLLNLIILRQRCINTHSQSVFYNWIHYEPLLSFTYSPPSWGQWPQALPQVKLPQHSTTLGTAVVLHTEQTGAVWPCSVPSNCTHPRFDDKAPGGRRGATRPGSLRGLPWLSPPQNNRETNDYLHSLAGSQESAVSAEVVQGGRSIRTKKWGGLYLFSLFYNNLFQFCRVTFLIFVGFRLKKVTQKLGPPFDYNNTACYHQR